MMGAAPMGWPRRTMGATGRDGRAGAAGRPRRLPAEQVEQMRHQGIVPNSWGNRWARRAPVLVALLVGLAWVGPASAVPSGQLAGSDATVVADEDLNVRASPGLEEPVIATIPPGSHVTIV